MDRCWSARRRSGECELLERRRFRSRREARLAVFEFIEGF